MEQVALAGLLGLFPCRLGVLEQSVGIGAVAGEKRDSSFHGDADVGVVQSERLVQATAPGLFDYPPDLGSPFHFRQHERELIGADAGDLGLIHGVRKAFGNLLEQRIARLPAEGIVDHPESLDVRRHDGELAFCDFRCMDVLGEPVVEQGAVGEPGELVVVGEVVEPLFLLDMVEREGDVAGQLEQQLHFLFVKKAHFAGI